MLLAGLGPFWAPSVSRKGGWLRAKVTSGGDEALPEQQGKTQTAPPHIHRENQKQAHGQKGANAVVHQAGPGRDDSILPWANRAMPRAAES